MEKDRIKKQEFKALAFYKHIAFGKSFKTSK